MATETIVAIYDTPAHAELAIADLTAAGIPAHSIQHYTGEQFGYGSYDAARDTSGREPARPDYGSQTYDPARDPSAHAGTSGNVQTGERSEGLWSWLFGDERDQHQQATHHQKAYDQSLQRGGTVVTVIVEQQAQVQRVLDILESHKPVDLEEHGGQSGGARIASDAGTAGAPGLAPGAAQPGMSADAQVGAQGRQTEEVIPLSEETLQVGKREVDRGATRVRRYVVERPVEEQVRLRDEQVSVFRRPVTNATVGADAFTDKTIDVRETAEEAVVSKSARVVEEVVVRKGVEERSETVRDTVRKEEVEITGPGGAVRDDGARVKTA